MSTPCFWMRTSLILVAVFTPFCVGPAGANDDLPGGLALPEIVAADIAAARESIDAEQPARAVEILEPLIDEDPDFYDALGLLGVAKIMTGEMAAGLQALNRLPDSAESFAALGHAVLLLENADTDEATVDPLRQRALAAARLAAGENADDPTVYLFLATMASRSGDYAEMKRATQVLTSRYPQESQGQFLAALVAAEEGDWETHAKRLQEAERLGMPAEILAEARADADRRQSEQQQAFAFKRNLVVGLLAIGAVIVIYRWQTHRQRPSGEAPAEA